MSLLTPTAIVVVTLSVVMVGTIFCADGAAPMMDDTEIQGYHFHAYFFQNQKSSRSEAFSLWGQIKRQSERWPFVECRLNNVNNGPQQAHPVGSFELCCNRTVLAPTLSWFMLNRGNHSILLHALTRYEIEDHTTRAMWLGQPFPLDLANLSPDLKNNVDRCRR